MSSERWYCRIDKTCDRDWMVHLLDVQVEIALDGDEYWITFPMHDDACINVASKLPGDRFVSWDGRWLHRFGHTVAERTVPNVRWQKLTDFVSVELPLAAFASRFESGMATHLELRRGGTETASAAAMMNMSDLARWVDNASSWRFRRLKYCHDGMRALVMGDPLPPVPCHYFTAVDCVLIPAGMYWYPRVDSQLVRTAFSVEPNEWLIWEAIDRWSILRDDLLVSLSRSSIRLAIQDLNKASLPRS